MPNVRAPFLFVWLCACADAGMEADLSPIPDGPSPSAPEDISASWSAQAQAAIVATEYAPRPDGEGFVATNRAQDLRASFGADGLRVTGRDGGGEVGLSLRAWGRDDAVSAAGAVAPEEGDCVGGGVEDAFGECLRQVQYDRPGLVEWWENRASGLEHGFTVTAAPDGDGPLVFDLAVSGARCWIWLS